MNPNDKTDDAANEWLNECLIRLRYEQDYAIYPGDSKPIIEDGKKTGIRIKREHVKLFSTGVTKIYRMAILKEELPVVEYTPEEEAEFDRKWRELYGDSEADYDPHQRKDKS